MCCLITRGNARRQLQCRVANSEKITDTDSVPIHRRAIEWGKGYRRLNILCKNSPGGLGNGRCFEI